MLDIFSQLIGKEQTRTEIEAIVAATKSDIVADFEDNEGSIYHENGGLEVIRFEIASTGKTETINNFRYYNSVSHTSISIYGGENTYYYVKDGQVEEFSRLDELVNDYVVFMSSQQD